jgi:hypothetical protein
MATLLRCRSAFSPLGRASSAASVLVALVLTVRSAPAVAQNLQLDFCLTDGVVNAVATSGNTVYIGGSFTQVGPATGSAVPLDATTGQPTIRLEAAGRRVSRGLVVIH